MNTLPACPQCKSDLAYQDGQMYVCPECAHEWSAAAAAPLNESAESENAVRDANGSILKDGDTVIVVKDLPVKGASSALKAGTKVKGGRGAPVDGLEGIRSVAVLKGRWARRCRGRSVAQNVRSNGSEPAAPAAGYEKSVGGQTV